MPKGICGLFFIVAGVIFVGTVFAETGNSYSPELMDAEEDAPVMLYVRGSGDGVTSAKSDRPTDFKIKSLNKKAIKIISVNLIHLIEGLDDKDNVLTYTKKEYKLSGPGIEKLNARFKRSNIEFSELVKTIDMKACSRKKSGGSVASKSVKFNKFKRVRVFNLLVEDSDGNQNKLQVCLETFQYPRN